MAAETQVAFNVPDAEDQEQIEDRERDLGVNEHSNEGVWKENYHRGDHVLVAPLCIVQTYPVFIWENIRVNVVSDVGIPVLA